MGVASGCGCKEFLILLISTPLVSDLFSSSIPTFCFLIFFVLVPVLFGNKIVCTY